jgi:hypothetical protein
MTGNYGFAQVLFDLLLRDDVNFTFSILRHVMSLSGHVVGVTLDAF